MSPVFRASARFWLTGLVLAVAGVALAREVAPRFDDAERARALIVLAGEIAALAGLFVIALGIRRRARAAAEAEESAG